MRFKKEQELNLTEKKYENILNGKEPLNKILGAKAIINGLKNIDVQKEIVKLRKDLKDSSPTDVNKLNRRLRYMLALKDLKMTAYDAYTTKYVPVLPPVFRAIYPLQTGDLMVSDLNKHYKDVGTIVMAAKNSKKTWLEGDEIEAAYGIYTAVKSLQGFTDPINYTREKYKGILKELSGKRALIQGST